MQQPDAWTIAFGNSGDFNIRSTRKRRDQSAELGNRLHQVDKLHIKPRVPSNLVVCGRTTRSKLE